MIIQSNYMQSSPATTPYSSAQRQTPAAALAVITDTVTISQVAQDRLAASEANTHPVKHSWIVQAAIDNPTVAEKMAYEMAYDIDGPLVDISGIKEGTGIIRYTVTGLPVTEESQTYFDQESSKVMRGRIALYETEKAKHAPPAEMIEKMIAYMDAQSDRYKQMIDWQGRAWGHNSQV